MTKPTAARSGRAAHRSDAREAKTHMKGNYPQQGAPEITTERTQAGMTGLWGPDGAGNQNRRGPRWDPVSEPHGKLAMGG